MTKKIKLRKLLQALSPDETLVDFKVFDDEVSKLKQSLKDKIIAKTVDDVNAQLDKFKKSVNIDNIVSAITKVRDDIVKKNGTLSIEVKESFDELTSLFDSLKKDTENNLASLSKDTEELKVCSAEHCKSIDDLKASEEKQDTQIKDVYDSIKKSSDEDVKEDEQRDKTIAEIASKLEKIRIDFISRFSNASRGGGSQNRKISINGTVISTRYTDINFKGVGVTYSASDNNTTKQVDLTLTASTGIIETPTGVVDGVNLIYTFTVPPTTIVVDQARVMVNGFGYSLVGLVATLDIAPVFSIFSI